MAENNPIVTRTAEAPRLSPVSAKLASFDYAPTQVGDIYKESQYTPTVFVQELPDLENRRAELQPWQDKLGNGLANMTISAFTGALESTVGMAYGAGTALFSGDSSKFYDNEFGRSLDAVNNSVRESNPFYYSDAEKNASLLGGMGYQNFWFDKVLGGAGYTVGSMLAGMGMAKVFQLGKTARLAQLTDEVNAAEKAGQLTAEALKHSRWDMGKQIALGGIMAHGESSMEARQTYDDTVGKYNELRALANDPNTDPVTKAQLADYANLTDEKIDQLGRSASDTNYLVNMAVTGPTDMILLGKFINPGKKAAMKTYNEIGKRTAVGGTVEYFDKMATKKARALLDGGTKFLKGFATEGTQEGVQFASNIAAQEFAELHGIQDNRWFSSMTAAIGEGLGETLSSKEGLESILVGGLVGGPFGLKGAGAERTRQDARTKQLVDTLNADPSFTAANPKVNAFLGALNAANKSEEDLMNGELFKAKNNSDQALNHYIKTQIDLGTADYFVEKLQGIKEMEQEERDKHFGLGTTPEQIDQVIEKVQKLSQLNDSIETLYGTPGGTPEQKAYNQRLRENLFFAASTIKDVEQRIDSIQGELTDMQDSEVQQLLALRENVKNVAKDTKVTELSDEAKSLIKNETDRLVAQIESQKQAAIDSTETERNLNLLKTDPEKYFNRKLEQKKEKATQYDISRIPGSLEMEDVERASKELDTIINKKSFLKPFEVPEGKTKEDYAMEMRDSAIDAYNQAVKEYIINNPVEGNQVSEMLADLNELDNRKYNFIEYYNELNDPKLAAKRLSQVEGFINEMQKQAQEEDNKKKESNALAKLNLESLDKLVKPNTRRETVINFNNQEVDITKMSNEELEELKGSMQVEANDLIIDGLTDEANAVREVLAKVQEELDFRNNAQTAIDQAREALAKAATPEDVDAIVKALTDTGYFTVDAGEVAQLKHNVTRKAVVDTKIDQKIRRINSNFRGVEEFYLSFVDKNSQMEKDFLTAIGREGVEKTVYFKLKPNPDTTKVSRIGNNDKLTKLSPPFIVEVWSKGGEGQNDLHIGYMPWPGQFADAQRAPLNIQDLTGSGDEIRNEELYNDLFEPDHSQGLRGYREFKEAHSKMEQLYKQLEVIFKNPVNAGKTEIALSTDKTLQLVGVGLTKGNYNIENKETPLSEFKEEGTATPPLVINDTPVIVSTSTFDGSSSIFYKQQSNDADKPNPITTNTKVASVLDSNGNPVLQDSTTLSMGTRAEFLPALEALRNLLSKPKIGNTIYNKYWMLVEDPQGSITIDGYEGKKFDWRPLTSRQLQVQETDALFGQVRALRAMLVGMDPQSPQQKEAKDALVKSINDSFFTAISSPEVQKELKNVSIGFTGNPESGLGVKIDLNTFSYDVRDSVVTDQGDRINYRSSQGQIFLQVPETALQDMNSFLTWFNSQLEIPQTVRWQISKDTKPVRQNNYILSNKIAPISAENFRLNFIGESTNPSNPNVKGITSITPDNVYDSFATRVSRVMPRTNQRLKITPTASAVTAAPVPKPQPTPSPAPVTPVAGPINVTPPPVLPAGVAMGEEGEVDAITAAFGPPRTLSTELEQLKKQLPETQENIRTRATQVILDYYADTIGVPRYSGDMKTGDFIIWLKSVNPDISLGNGLAMMLNTPKKAFDMITKYKQDLAKAGKPAPAAPVSDKKVSVKGRIAEQGTSIELEIIGDTGKEFLLTVDRKGNINLFSEKQPDGSYKAGEPASKEAIINLYKKYVPSNTILKIQKWLASFTGSWAAPETQDGKNYDKAEKELNAELTALGATPTEGQPRSSARGNRNLSAEEIEKRTGKKPGPVRSVGKLEGGPLATEGGLPGVGGVTKVFRTKGTGLGKLGIAYRGSGVYYAIDKPFQVIGTQGEVSEVEVDIDPAKTIDLTTKEGQKIFGNIQNEAKKRFDALPQSSRNINTVNDLIRDIAIEKGYTGAVSWIEPGAPSNEKLRIGREYVSYTGNAEITPGQAKSIGKLRNMKLSGEERIKMEDAAARLAKILPSWISVEEMAPLLENWREGRVTFGSFYNNIIKLSRLAPKGTELHEAFHAVFRTLLTDKQQDALYKEAKDMMIRDLKKQGKSFVQGFAQFKKDRPDYTEVEDMTEEQLKNLYIEEWMADEFARQSKTALAKKQQAPKSGLASLWEQFMDLINRMVRFFTGQKQLTRLFADIEAGRFKAAEKPVVNRFSKNPELNVEARLEIFTGYELKPNGDVQATFLDPTYEQRFINTIASKVLARINSAKVEDRNVTADEMMDEELATLGQFFSPENNPEVDYDNPDPSIEDRVALLGNFDFILNGQSDDAVKSRTKLKNEIRLRLKEFNIDEFDSAANEDYDGSEDNSTERSFDLNNENKGGFSSLSKALRKYISTTVYTTTLDEFLGLEPNSLFGAREITTTVDPQKVYNGIVKMAANQADPSGVIRKMHYYARSKGEGAVFINKFFEEAGLTFDDNGDFTFDSSKKPLVQRVVKAFNLYEVDYLFTGLDTKNLLSKTFSANRRNVDKIQTDLWQANYSILVKRRGIEELKRRAGELNLGIITTNVTRKIETPDGKIFNEERPLTESEITEIISGKNGNPGLKQKFAGLGISLSEQYLRYIVLSATDKVRDADQERFVMEFQSSVKITAEVFKKNMDVVTQLIEEGKNPYIRGTKLTGDTEGALTKLMNIAKDNAIFDETVVMSTMNNAEGKNVYPYQKATYHIQKFFELQGIDLNDPDVLQQIQSEKPNSDFLEGNRLLNNKVFQALLSNLRIERIDGARQQQLDENLKGKMNTNNAEGVTYGKMSPRELALTMYTLFTDSSTDMSIPVTTEQGKIKYVKTPVRRFLFNVMEASNTADTVRLPVTNLIDDNEKITQEFKDAYFAEIKREYDRIQRVRNGEYADKYNKFNAFTEKEEDQRGRQFWETKEFLDSIDPTGMLKRQLESGEVTLEEATPQIMAGMDEYFRNELLANIEKLKELGIIKEDNTNRMLPKVYEGGIGDDPLFASKNLLRNISNVYLNDLLNSISINQILMGDPAMGLKNNVDWFKRARGNNASGDNMLGIDPNQNAKPVRMVTIGRINEKGELDDFYNEEYKLSTRIYQIDSPEYKKFRQSLSEEERAAFDEQKPKQIAVADAQAFTTVNGMMGFLDSLGRLSERAKEIYERIAKGERIAPKDWKILKDENVMLNSQKLVYYDGVTYVKMSVAVLSPEYTSDSNGNARPGMEFLDNLRKDMEAKNIEMVGPPSMMKKMIKNPYIADPANPSFDIEESNVQLLDRGYLRLQMENPSNKTQIKDPTQQQNIITAEQTTAEIDFPFTREGDKPVKTGKDLVNWYDGRLAERVRTTMIPARNFLLTLKDNKWTINMKRATKVFKKVLEETGASAQVLSYLEVDENGNPLYNLNSPNIVKEFEQHFNAYFNKVLSQKVPGYKTTLQSGFMHRVLEDKQTGRIISTVEYDADPSKYADRSRYEPRRLAFDQPRMINGKEVHRYSEVVIPFHFAEQFNLKPGDAIPEELAYLFGTRIPSQDKHSAMALKIVDVLPPHAGSNMIAPDELIILTGSDFDVDSFFIQRPGHYFKNGKFMVYGNNEDSKWEQFKTWHRLENRLVKDLMDEMETELLQTQGAKEGETFTRIKKAALQKVRDAERADALVSELGMAGEGYDALTESDKELVAQLPTLREEYKRSREIVETLRQSLLVKALDQLGLPSTEEGFAKMGIRSIGEINNDLLNARMVLHSNPAMNDINKTPATLIPVESSLERLASDYGYGSWREMETKRSANSILGKLEAFETNKAGQAAIGAAVNNTNNYTIISRFGIQMREDADVQKVTINGKEIDGISNAVFTTRDMKRIMDVLSSLTSSMTDNTKYGYNSKLNLDINTLSVVSLLTMNQVGIYDAIRLVNSQYVVKYGKETQQYAIQSEAEENKKRQIGDDLVGELIGRAIKASGDTRTGKEVTLEGNGPVTNDDLVLVTRLNPMSKALAGKTIAGKKAFYEGLDPQELYNYYMAELRILNSYLTLSTKHGPEFIAFSQIVKLTKGISSSTKETSFKGDEELRRYLEQLNLKLVETKDGWRVDYGDAKKEDLPLYDFKNILNNHLISLENLKVFAVKSEAQKSYFISQSKFAEELRTKLNKGLKKRMKNKVRSKAMTQVRRDIESFLMTRAWRNSLPENERENLNNYLFPDIAKKNGMMSVSEITEEILKQNPHLDKNLVLQQVFFKEEVEGLLSKIETNTRTKGNKGFEGMVLTAMRTLANNEGYPIVNAMIKHLIAKNGLQFKNDSPVGLFSPGIYGSEFPFSELMDKYTSVLNTGTDEDFKRIFGKTAQELMAEFQELFMLDINNRNYITKIYGDGTISDKALSQVPKGITSPITKTDTGFTVDFDKGIRNIKNEALYDDAGNLVETLDTTAEDKAQRAYNFGKMKTFQFDKNRQVIKREKEDERTVTVFNFPEFIQVGFTKYKLKQYVPAATRYKKDEAERFTTKPDEDGNYMGIAATYEKVPTLGYWGVSVIGRTIEEARERTFDDMLALKKKAEGGEQSAAQDSEEAEMDDEYLDYAATTSNIPTIPVQVVGAASTTEPAKSNNPATWKKGDKIIISVIARRNSEYATEILDIFTDNDVTYSIQYKSSSGEIKQIDGVNKNGDFSERFDYEYGILRYVTLADTSIPAPSTPTMSKQDQLVQKNIQNAVGTSVTAGEADTNAKDLLIFSLTSKGYEAVKTLYFKMYDMTFGKNPTPMPAIFNKLAKMGIFAQKSGTKNPDFNDQVNKVVSEATPAEILEMNQKLC